MQLGGAFAFIYIYVCHTTLSSSFVDTSSMLFLHACVRCSIGIAALNTNLCALLLWYNRASRNFIGFV